MADRTFQFRRVDVDEHGCSHESSDGYFVAAQDAIDREAVLQAKIRVLEVQLKEAKVNNHG